MKAMKVDLRVRTLYGTYGTGSMSSRPPRPPPGDDGGAKRRPSLENASDGQASPPPLHSSSFHESTIPVVDLTGETPCITVKNDATTPVTATSSPTEAGKISKATSTSRSDVLYTVSSSVQGQLENGVGKNGVFVGSAVTPSSRVGRFKRINGVPHRR